jgi:K+-transporting ATPase ATPase A chain
MGVDSADIWFGVLQIATLVLLLALLYRPVGDLMFRIFTGEKDAVAERVVYRLIGVDPRSEQTWQAYTRGVLAFSLMGVLFVYALQRLQALLPASLGLPAVPEGLAFNTAASFVTNTNWQSYSPRRRWATSCSSPASRCRTSSRPPSASPSRSRSCAASRGAGRARSATSGSISRVASADCCRWRSSPSCCWPAASSRTSTASSTRTPHRSDAVDPGRTGRLAGGDQDARHQRRRVLQRELRAPFENPTPWTNLFQLLLILVIPISLPRTFGRMVGDNRQGYAILAVMSTLAIASIAAVSALEVAGHGTAPQLAGGAMEGKEQRFGIVGSALYAAVTTLTSTGAVNSMHDSYTATGGMIPLLNMMLGEVAPGGVGSGLYGMLVLAIIAVFVGGLLVGRTPEYLGKKIGPTQIKLASLYILVTPTLVLAGTALSFGIPAVRADVEATSILNPGIHGMTEVLYAFTSAANNNGSAFAGLTANTPWFNTALGVVMLLGRFVPIVLVLALAGSLAAQERVPATAGTLPTHRPQFVGLLAVVTSVITALTYFPVLALGPLAEGLLK